MDEKKKIKLNFMGFDDWHRPVFKMKDENLFFGSTHYLGDEPSYSKKNTINGQNAVEFFKENPGELEYFGREFNCEPNGGQSKTWEFEFIDDSIRETE
jgi:hypothetical protein